MRLVLASLILTAHASGCALERSPLEPDAGFGGPHDSGLDGAFEDAPERFDSGADSPIGVDAPDVGIDAGACSDGLVSAGETDVDCGGACGPCAGCRGCAVGTDCGSGVCSMGLCAPELQVVVLPSGATVPAYVREDGAVLLAHYGPGDFHRTYDPRVSQVTNRSGGAVPPPDFAPDPCLATGHLDLDAFDPAGRTVEMACGASPGSALTVRSNALFSTFALGDKGIVGATGTPGWGNLSALAVPGGRTQWGVCGAVATASVAGIGYCSGPSDRTPANNLVSFSSTATAGYIACGGVECSGPSCAQHVWVWLHPG